MRKKEPLNQELDPSKDYIIRGDGEFRGEHKPQKKKRKYYGEKEYYMLTILTKQDSIFSMIYYKMGYDNRIILTMDYLNKIQKQLGISLMAIYRFIDGEIKNNTMIRVKQGEYFVNPAKYIKCSIGDKMGLELEYYKLKATVKPKEKFKKPKLFKMKVAIA